MDRFENHVYPDNNMTEHSSLQQPTNPPHNEESGHKNETTQHMTQPAPTVE